MPSHLSLVRGSRSVYANEPDETNERSAYLEDTRPLIEQAVDLARAHKLVFVLRNGRHLKIGPINFYGEKGTVHIDTRSAPEGRGIDVFEKVILDPASYRKG